MTDRILIVDGMLSGTGIRDGGAGGYVPPAELGLSTALQSRISTWLARYEHAHYYQFSDKEINAELDREGVEIAKKLKAEIPAAAVEYFSNAYMRRIKF